MTSAAPVFKQRRPYRVPTGLPETRDNWRVGTAVSLLIHLGVVVLILAPFAASADIRRLALGAGGPGPAGGGGGGNRGTGGSPERIEFVRVSPAIQPPTVRAPEPAPKPVPEPPKPVVKQLRQVQEPAPIPLAVVATIGSGGTGTDNTAGQGPGSGGGVGTGIGTGRGSGVGSGTGGGDQENYPPTPYEVPLPPMPIPSSVKGDSIIAEFDVDETGRVIAMKFTETGDRGYNRRIGELLRSFKFRPGTTPEGRPIRMKTQVVFHF